MSIILAILALMIMIILHEWGHFIAGRICKTPIHEFSIGMGPLIFQKKGKKETTFSLRAIPLGGYCAFDSGDSTGVVDSSLNKLPIYKRMFIFIMGPLMNVITALIISFGIAMFMGFPSAMPVVDSIVENSACENILQPNDEILAVNGKEINGDSSLMSQYINETNGETFHLTILRDEQKLTVAITPKFDEASQRYLIGIMQKYKYTTCTFTESIKYAGTATLDGIVSTYQGLAGMITGKYKMSDMSGVVGIVGLVSEYATPSTFSVFLSLCALISVNLGIMNLLPIPGLDGSKIIFSIYEAIFKKPIPEKVEYYMTMVGFGALILLFIVVTFSDIIKLF
jgi:regulator of sigma E protease